MAIHSFNTAVAKEIGLLPAILLHNIDYWCEKNKANEINFHDDRWWTFNSTTAFEKMFNYATKRQIEYALDKLKKGGYIVTGNYNQNSYDRTLWYAITNFGKSILQNCEMDITNLSNRNHEIVTPIPNSKPNIKPNSKPYIYQELLDTYNSTCTKLSKASRVTDKRKAAINKFLKEFTKEEFKTICENVNKSDFYTGKNDRNWKADFDFLLRPDKAVKLLETKDYSYKDKYQDDDEGAIIV